MSAQSSLVRASLGGVASQTKRSSFLGDSSSKGSMSARTAIRRPSTVQSAFPVVIPSTRDSAIAARRKITTKAVREPEQSSMASASDKLAEYVANKGGKRVIRKVLVANNGMAATKAILSMRRWAYNELGDENAIKFVAMATPEDIGANAEFIRYADDFVEVPGGKNVNNYANVDLITEIAVREGVDGV